MTSSSTLHRTSLDPAAPPSTSDIIERLRARFGDITPMTVVSMPQSIAINPVKVGAGVAVAKHPGVLFPIADAQFSDSGMASRWCCRVNQLLPFTILQQTEVEIASRYTDGMPTVASQISQLIDNAPAFVGGLVLAYVPCNPGYSFVLVEPTKPYIAQPIFKRDVSRTGQRVEAIEVCRYVNKALGVESELALTIQDQIDGNPPRQCQASLSETWDINLQ